MNNKSILIMIHCAESTGYAIAALENVFLLAARKAGFSDANIFWSFKTISTKNNAQIMECDYLNPQSTKDLMVTIKEKKIETVIAFDLGFPCAIIPILKKAGIKRIISYWGASMSGINSGIKLKLKKIQCLLIKNKPDFFIFESEAMRKTATHGRGVKTSHTGIIYLGVDTKRFFPNYNKETYTHDSFNIPNNRKIVFYSGHMEERKGVRVITEAAIHLIDTLGFLDVHFVICGNKTNEAQPYESILADNMAKNHVTFAGYRSDIPELMRGSHIGVIASTGWDSFTMSSIEMMASGLPMIVSNLQGLSETIEHNINGFLITPGDHKALAEHIITLISEQQLAHNFSLASRLRAENKFSASVQIEKFSALMRSDVQ